MLKGKSFLVIVFISYGKGMYFLLLQQHLLQLRFQSLLNCLWKAPYGQF